MSAQCPHCGGAIRLISQPSEPPPAPREEEFLEPATIAERLGIGAAWVRTLCRRAFDKGDHGVRRIGERNWLVTLACIKREQAR